MNAGNKTEVNIEKEKVEVKEEINSNSETTKVKEKGAKKAIKAIFLTLKIITWTLIIAILSVLIMTVVLRKTDVFGYRLYIIVTGSMEPTIHVKDAILTKEASDFDKGDIIVFEQGDLVTIHRIIEVYTEGDSKLYQTKGDANNIIDKNLVKTTQIKGKVIGISSIIGNIIYWLQHHIILFVIGIGILLIITVIRRLI